MGDLFPAKDVQCGQVEVWARGQGIGLLIGLDEAGRGPLAGPVVAGAAALADPCPIDGLNDSKALSGKVREILFERIHEEALAFGVAVVSPEEIDRINILQASLRAMGLAWKQLVDYRKDLAEAVVLVDGNKRAHLPGHIDQRPIVKGDARSLNIAAASILAKVTRDRIMLKAHETWPQYGFDRHKGYPTAQHRQALRDHGPCPIHRRSFRMPQRT